MIEEVITIYSDGACSGNPGPGGWGAVLSYKGHEKEIFGGSKDTTNNRMELLAAIEALRSIKKASTIEFYTDSNYVKDGISKWIHSWKQKNWKGSNGKAIKNIDLWKELEAETERHTIHWHWVKGHAGHPMNERADALARKAIPRS